MAFKRVGSTAGRYHRETHRTLDACALAALTAIRDQQERLKQFSMSVQSGARKVAWLWVEKRWDETPGEFAFGQLLDLARPIAKYWWRGPSEAGDGESCWRRLSYEEYRSRGLSKEPMSGSLQMMGQTMTLTWSELHPDIDFHIKLRENFYFQPVFMTANTSSCLFRALDSSALPFDELTDLAKRTPFVVLSLVSDLDSANTRLKREMGRRAVLHNQTAGRSGQAGMIILLDLICFCHSIHRFVETTFKLNKLICGLHATAFVCNQTRVFLKIVGGLRQLVAFDLNLHFYPHVRPPPEHRRRSEHVLRTILWRPHRTRARSSLECPTDDTETFHLMQALFDVLNGGWRKPFFEHYCYNDNCCGGQNRETCIDRMVAALSQAVFNRS